jgi:hypothetical protein
MPHEIGKISAASPGALGAGATPFRSNLFLCLAGMAELAVPMPINFCEAEIGAALVNHCGNE